MGRLIDKRLLLDGKVQKKLRGKIIETLTDGAQGMFRWVAMSLEYLQRIKFISDFKSALGRLPSELSGLYGIIHAQIDDTETHGRDVAIMTLKWLLCAQRLLSIKELIAAIYTAYKDADESLSDSDEDDESRSDQTPSPENDIIRHCRNLVVIDSEQQVFRFAHQFVREYLLNRRDYSVVEQHALATERCLDVYLAEAWPSSITPNIVHQNSILKPYARMYWPVHYKYVDDYASNELKMKVSQFTVQGSKTSPAYIKWASDLRSERGRPFDMLLNTFTLDVHDPLGVGLFFALLEPLTRLSVACGFGFLSFLKDPTTDWNQRFRFETRDYTMLHIAAECGQEAVVQLLLENGAEMEAKDYYEATPLHCAAKKGQVAVLRLLLEKGAEVNANDDDGRTALLYVAAGCHGAEDRQETVMQLLLESGAKIEAKDNYGYTALYWAASGAHEGLMQLLLEKGADTEAKDSEGKTLLHIEAGLWMDKTAV